MRIWVAAGALFSLEIRLKAAVNDQAAAILTFNRWDFGAVPAGCGIDVLTAALGQV